jgi:RNA polymerase-binding transcription factor DksA
LNADAYLEVLQEQEYLIANDRKYGQHKYAPEDEGYGPEECECGAEMPEPRRAYGFKLCVPCKELTERRG